MIVFSTPSAAHLANATGLPQGNATIKKFSDGELHVSINQDVCNKTVWVVANTGAPADNFFELLFLIDALAHAHARTINLIIPYFGYARQLQATAGTAQPGRVVCTLLKQMPIDKLWIIHPHNPTALKNALPFTKIIDYTFFATQAQEFDAIAAPDNGALALAQAVADQCNKEFISLSKKRAPDGTVEIVGSNGTVHNKKILLVDDIIATGQTVMHAADYLKNLGAKSVSAAAMHGVFGPQDIDHLLNSNLDSIHISNTINQQSGGKIHVHSVAPLLYTVISQNS